MRVLRKNNVITGLWVGVSSIVLTAMLVYLTLVVINFPLEGGVRFFLFSFIPIAVLIRYYMRILGFYVTGRTLVCVFVAAALPLLFYLLKSNEIHW